jgi:cytochrome c oxidase subunit II
MSSQPSNSGGREPRHARNAGIIWAIATVIMVPVMIWVIGPHIPPGDMSNDTKAQHDVNVVLSTLAMPVLMLVWVVIGYSIVNFRSRSGDTTDGPPITGHFRLQVGWVVGTACIVIALAAYGTIDLLTAAGDSGVGSGEGSNPLVKPADAKNALQVQVIGQQWLWTFRYPGYGGVETAHLVLPVNRDIEFHVTSLDVVHSFWAIELGVKADAVPGADNIAFVTADKTGSFQVRCDELCGLWHGHMNTTGNVVSDAKFNTWIAGTVKKYAPVTSQLPKYSTVYYPQPVRNG